MKRNTKIHDIQTTENWTKLSKVTEHLQDDTNGLILTSLAIFILLKFLNNYCVSLDPDSSKKKRKRTPKTNKNTRKLLQAWRIEKKVCVYVCKGFIGQKRTWKTNKSHSENIINTTTHVLGLC